MNKRRMKLQNIMEANKRLNGQLINEQVSNPYKVGQIFQAKRSTDGKIYTIKIIKVLEKDVMATITGPGTYENRPLNGIGTFELDIIQEPNVFHANMEMGNFTIVKKIK